MFAAVWGVLIHPEDKRDSWRVTRILPTAEWSTIILNTGPETFFGEWCWLRCRGRMVRDNEGKPEYFAGFITNMGKKNLIDHMTGLYNRYELEGTVKKHLVDDGRKFGLMILDMDEFKNVNDLYDRSFGDEVLRVTAQMISSLLPSNARMYRLDGDELPSLILNGDWDEHIQIFNRIRYKMHRQSRSSKEKILLYGFRRLCRFPGGWRPVSGTCEMRQLFAGAFQTAWERQNHLFSPDILPEKERRLELMELLRESIEHGFAGFQWHTSPRWKRPQGSFSARRRWQDGPAESMATYRRENLYRFWSAAD